MRLKKLNDSTTAMVHHLFGATFSPFAEQDFKHSSEASTFLLLCRSSINHHLSRSITAFICDYGKQQYTLVEMHKIVKSLTEINQEVLSDCKEEWSHTELFPLFYDYYRIIHGTCELYNDFLRLLKDAFDSWLSVKLALEQILAKSRRNNDYSYREMLEQLNDLETSKGIRFCDVSITRFAYFCKQTVAFSRHLNKDFQDIKKFTSMNTLAKVSEITIAGIFGILATYMSTNQLSQEMKGGDSYSTWLCVIHILLNWQYDWFYKKGSYGRELQIWEFLDCAIVVQELKTKMARFSSFTHQNEKEMIIVIYKLERMMDNIAGTIEDMRTHAHLYSLDIKEVGIALNQFIVDSNLQLSVTGVRFLPPSEEQQCESPVSEAMTIMYRATLSLIHTGLEWYIRACEEKADSSRLLSGYSSICDNTTSIILIISSPYCLGTGTYSLDYVHKVITCLHAINQEGFMALSECKEEWRNHPLLFDLVNDYLKICLQTSWLYNDFVSLLNDGCDSRLSLMMRLKEGVVNCRRAGDYQNSELDLDDDDGSVTFSGDFMKLLVDICQQTVGFTRQFNEEILELKSVKVLAKISSGLIAGVLSVMTVYMVDLRPFLWMEEKPLTCLWLHLNRCFSWKSPLKKNVRMVINDILDNESRLSVVKTTVNYFLCAKFQSEESFIAYRKDTMLVIDSAAKKMDKLSVTIEEMRRHADTLNDDIIKAGISLELISEG